MRSASAKKKGGHRVSGRTGAAFQRVCLGEKGLLHRQHEGVAFEILTLRREGHGLTFWDVALAQEGHLHFLVFALEHVVLQVDAHLRMRPHYIQRT